MLRTQALELTDYRRICPGDFRVWTNSHVLHWLVAIDQKLFVPIFIEHNVTGSILAGLLGGKDSAGNDFRNTLDSMLQKGDQPEPEPPAEKKAKHDKPKAKLAKLSGLLPLPQQVQIEALKFAIKQLTAPKPNGWWKSRDTLQWFQQKTRTCKREEYRVIETWLRFRQERLELLILFLSTLTASLTVAVSSLQGDSDACTEQMSWLDWSLFAALSVLSIMTTMVAGFKKLANLGEISDSFAEWQRRQRAVIEFAETGLSPHRLKREDYEVFAEKLKKMEDHADQALWHSTHSIPPNWSAKSVLFIRDNDPQVWQRCYAPFVDYSHAAHRYKCANTYRKVCRSTLFVCCPCFCRKPTEHVLMITLGTSPHENQKVQKALQRFSDMRYILSERDNDGEKAGEESGQDPTDLKIQELVATPHKRERSMFRFSSKAVV